jgi:hypothetical protein
MSEGLKIFLMLTMVKFFRQDDVVHVSKFLRDCLVVMLGADSDDQSQTSDQP